MALLIFRKNKQNLTNKILTFDFILVGLWILCGFPSRIVAHPSNVGILWEFRLANLFGNSALLLALFFVYSLNNEKRPKKWMLIAGSIVWALVVLISMTPLGFVSGEYQEGGAVTLKYGSLFSLLSE
jgi:hypothetical protein